MPITQTELANRVIEWIRQYGQANHLPAAEITAETDLLANGLLDSFGFVDLIMFIESQDGCKVDLTGVEPEEFSVVQSLCRIALRNRQ